MKIIEPSVDTLHFTPNAEQIIEAAGRVCYRSEDRITEDSHVKFVRMLLDPSRAHESVLEHASAGFHITTDRGITHELVRHRIASFSQESTRYCNYSKGKFGNEITVVRPSGMEGRALDRWKRAVVEAESHYLHLLAEGVKPQDARSVLPTCVKAEIVMTANLREWRHFLKLRLSPAAHPDMRIIAGLLLDRLKFIAPTVFEEFIPCSQ